METNEERYKRLRGNREEGNCGQRMPLPDHLSQRDRDRAPECGLLPEHPGRHLGRMQEGLSDDYLLQGWD